MSGAGRNRGNAKGSGESREVQGLGAVKRRLRAQKHLENVKGLGASRDGHGLGGIEKTILTDTQSSKSCNCLVTEKML